jgi:hypothetical protein
LIDSQQAAHIKGNTKQSPNKGTNDGTNMQRLNTLARKRHQTSDFPPATESVAKRTALQATPEKMKQLPQTRHKIGHNEREAKQRLNIGLTKEQSKYKRKFRGLMAPSGPALKHPAAPLLLELATLGCSSDTGDQWHMDLLEAAIKKGAHPSAMAPEAAEQLRSETLEKVEQGYARLVKWDDIRDHPPRNLKVSPIAAIPHKSRLFQMILGLSHGVRLHGIQFLSINGATNKRVAPAEAMSELGTVLPCLSYAMANAPDGGDPILFSKLDIKDG